MSTFAPPGLLRSGSRPVSVCQGTVGPRVGCCAKFETTPRYKCSVPSQNCARGAECTEAAAGANRRATGLSLLCTIGSCLISNDAFATPTKSGPEALLGCFQDSEDAFKLKVPEGWTYSIPQQPYDRFRAGVSTNRTLTWYPSTGTDVNVAVVITTPGADYTSLASFGSASDFASNLVSSMDRSYLAGGRGANLSEVQVAKLVSASSDGRAYVVEYIIQRGTEEQKHLFSRVVMGSNGRFRRLYTITATCPESKLEDFGPLLQASVASLTLDKVA